MTETPTHNATPALVVRPGWASELTALWQGLPRKGFFLVMLAALAVLFHLYGTSTLGYFNTRSLFGWWWKDSTRDLRGAH
jgi:hypothetical protein